jgi:hypothetical protein
MCNEHCGTKYAVFNMANGGFQCRVLDDPEIVKDITIGGYTEGKDGIFRAGKHDVGRWQLPSI